MHALHLVETLHYASIPKQIKRNKEQKQKSFTLFYYKYFFFITMQRGSVGGENKPNGCVEVKEIHK